MNKKQIILAVMTVSFLAVTVFYNLRVGIFMLFNKVLDVDTYYVTCNGLGHLCKTPHAHTIGGSWFGLKLLLSLFFGVTAFLICRKGYREQNYLLLIGGAFLFYFPGMQAVTLAYDMGRWGLPWFLQDPVKAKGIKLAWFGNQYNYAMMIFTLRVVAVSFYLLMAYFIVFRYWDNRLRLYFFTIGLLSFFAGMAFWAYALGPLIYTGS